MASSHSSSRLLAGGAPRLRSVFALLPGLFLLLTACPDPKDKSKCDDCDADGYVDVAQGGDDCDDTNESVYPGATEIACDDIDQDCDGVDDTGDTDGDGSGCGLDCDETDASIHPGAKEIACDGIDQDCDKLDLMPDLDKDGYTCDQDCDDTEPSAYYGATEIVCDGIDQDCDGLDLTVDTDKDGYACDQDCDETNPDIHVGAKEIACDDIDQDCDSEDLRPDPDSDGHACADDCDESNPDIHADMAEIACDGIDQNCDGADLIPDIDSDGYTCDQDCDDTSASVHVGAEEISCDGIDQDCDGEDLSAEEIACDGVDQDCDGEDLRPDLDGDAHACADDCDDTNAAAYVGAVEIPCDGIDQDCDGADLRPDLDGDGYACEEDCDDSERTVYVGASEIECDGVDQDCDGEDLRPDLDGDLHACEEDCDEADDSVYLGAEEIFCDGIDQDCDGEDSTEDIDGDGFDCLLDCDEGNPEVYVGADDPICDRVDQDCDGCDGVCGDADTVDSLGHLDLVIDEVLQNSNGSEPANEWFELRVDTDGPVDLEGLTIEDALGSEIIEVDRSFIVCPEEYIVFGYSAHPFVDWVYGDDDFRLSNASDAILLYTPLRLRVDGVEYDDGETFPDPSGASMSLDPDDGTTWCTSDFSTGWIDLGTPGMENDSCFCEDSDGDGWDDCSECAPSDPEIHPGATEIRCDGIDQDCDGLDLVDDADGDGRSCDDCDDTDPSVYPGAREIACDDIDQDCDGADSATDTDGDGYACDDCDVDDPTIHPGAPEIACDGIDQDCDGADSATDSDGDGYGCDDCDDSDPTVHPGADDPACDGLDQNCDGIDGTIEGIATVEDLLPGDLVINEILQNPSGSEPAEEWFEVYVAYDAGVVDLNGLRICDDDCSESSTVSRAMVVCEGDLVLFARSGSDFSDYLYSSVVLGNGSDTLSLRNTLETLDQVTYDDGRTFPDPSGASMNLDPRYQDASDNDSGDYWCPARTSWAGGDLGSPGQENEYCDLDGDGVYIPDDCDDSDATIYPGAIEIPCDGIDQDCDGADSTGDTDGDGYSCDDCDDSDATVHPGATEISCDGIDQDCDGTDLTRDSDGDSYSCGADCDDSDATVHPGAVEMACDGTDQDCDGADLTPDLDLDGYSCATDCNDMDRTVYVGAAEIPCDGIDQDCDGADYVDDADGDGYSCDDCDDTDATVNPGATEIPCDGIDQDCDGSDLDTCSDADGDGYSSVDAGGTDCDDSDATVHPGADDPTCDGADQDCDGCDGHCGEALSAEDLVPGDIVINEVLQNPSGAEPATEWFELYISADLELVDLQHIFVHDDDSSELFRVDTPLRACGGDLVVFAYSSSAGVGDYIYGSTTTSFVLNNSSDMLIIENAAGVLDQISYDNGATFPDPANATMNLDPGFQDSDSNDLGVNWCTATLAWAGADLGSPGEENEVCDLDHDSVGYPDDCDDHDASAYPGATEIMCDGIDQDCDGADICTADFDGDGYDSVAYGGTDCDDTQAEIHPGATEIPCDGIDQDCDLVDLSEDIDGDDYACDTDCDETSADVHPGATEIPCDGIDQDCDGADSSDCGSDADGDGYTDILAGGTDCDDSDETIHPGADDPECDDIDQDCDGCDGICDELTTAAELIYGDLVITEVLQNSTGTEPDYEWFEVYVAITGGVDLEGLTVRNDTSTESFTVTGALPACGGDYVVFANSASSGVGDYLYNASSRRFQLANGSDWIILEYGTTRIDEINYLDGSSGWPSDSAGHCMNLDTDSLSSSLNDIGTNWCNNSTSSYPSIDPYCTPGSENIVCE